VRLRDAPSLRVVQPTVESAGSTNQGRTRVGRHPGRCVGRGSQRPRAVPRMPTLSDSVSGGPGVHGRSPACTRSSSWAERTRDKLSDGARRSSTVAASSRPRNCQLQVTVARKGSDPDGSERTGRRLPRAARPLAGARRRRSPLGGGAACRGSSRPGGSLTGCRRNRALAALRRRCQRGVAATVLTPGERGGALAV
jgi:hypothetical protein